MKLRNVPNDLGDPGVGDEFRRMFQLWVKGHCPDVSPERKWVELWEIFDRAYPDEGDIILASRIVDYVILKITDELDI
jgi:hypothetical protein